MDVSNVFERRSLNKNFEEKKRNGIKSWHKNYVHS